MYKFEDGLHSTQSASDSPWRAAGLSIRGTSHQASSIACQDYCVFDQHLGTTFFVVADGAGSSSKSDFGARIACEAAIHWFSTQLMNEDFVLSKVLEDKEKLDFVSFVSKSINQQAIAFNMELREFRCTLLGVVVHDGVYLAFQIGDGFIVYEDELGFHSISTLSLGEYINETDFITDVESSKSIRVEVIRNPSFLALSTDGLERLALTMPTRQPFNPFFSAMKSWIKADGIDLMELAESLNSEEVHARTDDDKTILVGIPTV